MCASALSDLSQLATASAAFKAAAAVLQTIADDTEQSSFHAILPQMLQVDLARCSLFVLRPVVVWYDVHTVAVTTTFGCRQHDHVECFWAAV